MGKVIIEGFVLVNDTLEYKTLAELIPNFHVLHIHNKVNNDASNVKIIYPSLKSMTERHHNM